MKRHKRARPQPVLEWFSDTTLAVLLAVLVIAVFADVVFAGRCFYKEDLSGYDYPMKKMVRDVSFAGVVPHWNPSIQGGQPLAANPAHKLFYPPQWLIYLPSFRYVFQIHILLHVILAAIGMFALLRSMQLSKESAVFGAVIFALGAPFLSQIVRLSMLLALAWLPLILLFTRRLVLNPNRRDLACVSLLFGVQTLGGEPTLLLQTGGLAVSYPLYRFWRDRNLRALAIRFGVVAAALAAGLVVAAVQIGPAVDHAGDSVRREGFEWRVATNWSTPPARFLELLFPRIFEALSGPDGRARVHSLYPYRAFPFIWHLYLGVATAALALAGFFTRIRGWGYVALLLALSAALAVGERTPLFRLLYESGLFESIRYPEKFLLSGIFVIVIWAAITLDRVVAGDRRIIRIVLLIATVWVVVATVMFFVAGPNGGSALPLPWQRYWAGNILRGLVALAVTTLFPRRNRFAIVALIVFAMIDMSFVHRGAAARVERAFFDEPSITEGIRQNRAQHRLFHRAAWDDWEGKAPPAPPGESPEWFSRNALMPYFGNAFGIRSVLENDHDQTGLLSSTAFLRATRETKRVTGRWEPFFLAAAGATHLAEFAADGSVRIRTREEPAPRYYFASRVIRVSSDDEVGRAVSNGVESRAVLVDRDGITTSPGEVAVVHDRPADVLLNVRSSRGGLLVAANTFHKYWRAVVDSQPVQITPVNIGFQGVMVPPGTHRVRLSYRNPLILPFGILSAAAILVLTALAFAPRRTDQRSAG